MNSSVDCSPKTNFFDEFGEDSGTSKLMRDIGELNKDDGYYLMGGGNPSTIPELTSILRETVSTLVEDETKFNNMFGKYSAPIGIPEILDLLAEYFSEKFNANITAKNIALTNGSQTSFYILFNLFGGNSGEHYKKIFLPLFPEYIGYLDCGVSKKRFVGKDPSVKEIDDMLFKYVIDFDSFEIPENTGALCISRPNNPTGNIVTDEEVRTLQKHLKGTNIPLILDCAYGAPFPGICHEECSPIWNEEIIYVMSLSKLGLPGARTGIIIAKEEYIRQIGAVNTGLSLAVNSIGQFILAELIKNKKIDLLAGQIIKNHYRQKLDKIMGFLREMRLEYDFRVHSPEGAFFLWLSFPSMKVDSLQLYEMLKERKVIILSGMYFTTCEEPNFTGKCIRINYAEPFDVVSEGLKIVFKTVAEFS